MKNIILKYFKKIFQEKGMQFDIENMSISCCNKFNLSNVTIQKGNNCISIKKIVLYYSVWKSLFNRRLIGKMSLEKISIDSHYISDQIFRIEAITSFFTLSRSSNLFQLDISKQISLFVQHTKNKGVHSIYIESEDIHCNNIISLFREHFQSTILRNSFSSDKFYIYIELKIMKNIQAFIPKIEARLIYKEINLYTIDSFSKEIVKICIDKGYLRHRLESKFHNKFQYVLLKSIPSIFIDTIICTEDPFFWSHRGISLFFIGNAIRVNVINKKILRGASTITMQLVRNLFLSHSRTLSRKLEECLISLLLENVYCIDKETILELYLNIIEFAPNIHGINRGSLHYFGKSPSELSLIEILTLTYIIPRPHFFEEALLLKTEKLKINLYNHIENISGIMFHQNLITSSSVLKDNNYSIHFISPFGTLDLHQ